MSDTSPHVGDRRGAQSTAVVTVLLPMIVGLFQAGRAAAPNTEVMAIRALPFIGVVMAFKPFRTVLAGLLLAVGAAGCGSSADEPDGTDESARPSASSEAAPPASSDAPAEGESPAATDAEPVVITIEDFAFAGPASVAPGATVMVVNEDSSSHTLTSEADEFEEVALEGGADGTFAAPTEPGRYDYVCIYHPEMTGTLVVK